MSCTPVDDAPVLDLLPLALAVPTQAMARAHEVLSGRPSPFESSVARQALGIVLRDRGELTDAIAELRLALADARRSGDPDRVPDVRATLGTALVWSGRASEGLAQLGKAARGARGVQAARILVRRAAMLYDLDRWDALFADLAVAMPVLRRADDEVWLGRALNWRGAAHWARGSVARAATDFAVARDLLQRAGQTFEVSIARHNEALVALARDDVPLALRLFDDAAAGYVQAGTVHRDFVLERCRALLHAGLAPEALAAAQQAQAEPGEGDAVKRAELDLVAARAALELGDPAAATTHAARAREVFARDDRSAFVVRAQAVLAHARYADRGAGADLLAEAESLAAQAESSDPGLARRLRLLAGRAALDLGLLDRGRDNLDRLVRVPRTAAVAERSLAHLATGLLADATGDRRAAAAACTAGLRVLDQALLTLGSSELRAYATAQGRELASLAARTAVARRDPWALLRAAERWRAITLTSVSEVPDDPELETLLAAVRAVALRAEALRDEPARLAVLDRRRRELERRVRDRLRQVSGDPRRAAGPHGPRPRLSPAVLRAALGDTRLAVLVPVDGTLHVVTVVQGRARRYALGELPVRQADHARFTLRRMAHGSASTPTIGLLDELGNRLQGALLGPAAADLEGDGPVVVVPPATFHSVPWALLPVLRDREVSVAPSVTAALRSRSARPPVPQRVCLAAGPDLGTGAGEVHELAGLHPDANVLTGDAATVGAVRGAMDGAWLAHLAAHGTFRADNPLFSALHLADGPLTVHELERLARAPYRVLLPCCDSGVGAQAGADEILGLVSALLAAGSAGVLAAVVPINDAATVPLMVAVHRALAAGTTLAEALRRARAATADDPLCRVTGYAFTAFGR